MDPVSAIGAASAVLSIVNLIAKNVSSLSDLQSRYGSADLKVSLLIGQLSTVKAAMNQMAKLLGSDFGTLRDPELIGDFSTSIGCVEAVVLALDDKISLIQRNTANDLTLRTKVNFMWDEKNIDDYLSLLNNQIHALGLLLTALQCRTALEQNNVLQSRESRHVFSRVKDDTSSLLWLRDAESVQTYRSIGTEDLGTVDATFTFDPEIFNSKVYQTATRSTMIHALLPNRQDLPGDTSSLAQASLHSEPIIDSPIYGADNTAAVSRHCKRGSITWVPEVHVSLSDMEKPIQTSTSSTSSIDSIPETIKAGLQWPPAYPIVSMPHLRYTIHTRETLRPLRSGSVWKYTPPPNRDPVTSSSLAPGVSVLPKKMGDLSVYRQLVSFQRSRRGQATQPHKSTSATVGRPDDLGVKVLLLGISESGKTTLQKSMKIAFEDDDEEWRLSHRSAIEMMIREFENQDPGSENQDLNIADWARLFPRPASQIVDHIPTFQDILWVSNRSSGSYEYHYVLDGTPCRFVDVGGGRDERKKWIKVFEDVNSIIFTLDVSSYDVENDSLNRMVEQLSIWDSLVQSQWFTTTNFIVLFTKVDRVTPSRLETSPFQSICPDYLGRLDSLEDILKYLAWRLEGASKEWMQRGLVFCNAGSIWDSPTSMAEIAVSALSEVAGL